MRKLRGQRLRGIGEACQQRLVDLDRRRIGDRRLVAQAEIDLAARQLRRNAFAHDRFERTQFLGQTQADFEIAMVDRAQLDRQRAVAGVGFGAGKSGHATQHRLSRGAKGAQW